MEREKERERLPSGRARLVQLFVEAAPAHAAVFPPPPPPCHPSVPILHWLPGDWRPVRPPPGPATTPATRLRRCLAHSPCPARSLLSPIPRAAPTLPSSSWTRATSCTASSGGHPRTTIPAWSTSWTRVSLVAGVGREFRGGSVRECASAGAKLAAGSAGPALARSPPRSATSHPAQSPANRIMGILGEWQGRGGFGQARVSGATKGMRARVPRLSKTRSCPARSVSGPLSHALALLSSPHQPTPAPSASTCTTVTSSTLALCALC